MTIKLLLPSLITNEDQEMMTVQCRQSLICARDVSKHNIEIIEDQKPYKAKVAGVWNNFLDEWRGKDYDYLMITANDTQADLAAIDYMVRCAEEHNAGMVTGKVVRDLEEFKKGYGKQEYTSELTTGLIDPACFVLKKGVIEKVGRIDEEWPGSFVERDYIYRMKLAGYTIIQPDVVLWYHPPYSGTLGNDQAEMMHALRKYCAKWGGDADREIFRYPYQNMNLDYTYCRK